MDAKRTEEREKKKKGEAFARIFCPLKTTKHSERNAFSTDKGQEGNAHKY